MRSRGLEGSRRALSLVVSSLILLVSSALLASGTIAYYAFTTTSASMRQEQLLIVEAHVWVNASGSQAALTLENIGGGDALIEYIEVKYSRVPWERVYHASSGDGELTPVQRLNISEPFTHMIGGASITFERASGPLAIESGEGATIYLEGPFDIQVSDVGKIILIVIHTAATQYPALVNAEFA
jgi:hypothetical protein